MSLILCGKLSATFKRMISKSVVRSPKEFRDGRFLDYHGLQCALLSKIETTVLANFLCFLSTLIPRQRLIERSLLEVVIPMSQRKLRGEKQSEIYYNFLCFEPV